jgi:hypothetical protein
MLAAVEIETGKATTWVNKTRKAADFVALWIKSSWNTPDSGYAW